MKNKIMTHVVAGYPNEEECIKLLLGMQKIGIRAVEVQIPFSDPIADGETIMIANDKALKSGMTTQKSFELIKTARKRGLKIEIYIMSYIQKVINCGIENFCTKAESVGTKGLIIPDLPIEAEEYRLLKESSDARGLEVVPVVSPGTNEKRLKTSVDSAKSLIYLTSIKGITGKKLKLNGPLRKTAQEIKKQNPDIKLAIGFGIEGKKDIEEVLRIADIAILGSSIIRKINGSGTYGAISFLEKL